MSRSVLPDRFEVREILGRGGLTTVYRAMDLRFDREVAVKVVRGPSWMTPAERRAWAAATSAAMRPHLSVWHPNLAFVRDIGQHGDAMYIVRDALPGDSAAGWGRLTFADAARVATSIAGAVDALAERGLAHGGLSARNVFRDVDGRIRVTDAGQSLAMASVRVAGRRCRVSPHQESRGDVHSLAGLVYNLVTGHAPQWSGRVLEHESMLPTEAAYAIRRALRGRGAGYASATAFATALVPLSGSSLWQAAWQPAAAAGLLICLGTAGGIALSEEPTVVPPQARVGSVARVTGPALPALAARLCETDRQTLRLYVKLQGPACLLNPGVQRVFGIEQRQALVIEAVLSEQRACIRRLVQAVADGYCTDTAAPMTAIRGETLRRAAEALDPVQRELWDWLQVPSLDRQRGL